MKHWQLWLSAAGLGCGLALLAALAAQSMNWTPSAELGPLTWTMIVAGAACVGLGLRLGAAPGGQTSRSEAAAILSDSPIQTSA